MTADRSSRFLIAVGTQNYVELGEEWTLDSVPADLRTVVELFTSPESGYREALGDLRHNPVSSQLRRNLQHWLNAAERLPADIAVMYYSGHGDVIGDTFYLITADTMSGQYLSTALDISDIVKMLRENSPVRRLLLIVDACYSGQAAHEIAEAVVRNARLLNFSRRGEGIWVLAASRPRQEARESQFTPALAKAVRYWQQNTGATQEYLALETILDTLAQELGETQQPYYSCVGAAGLPPFFPNPNFRDDMPVGVDLETRARLVRLQHERTEHWEAKARGLEVTGQAGWYFTGRRAALDRLSEFLVAPGSDTRVHILTGDPGSGKSAVLGRLVMHVEQSQGVRIASPGGFELPELRIDAALLARGKTVTDLRGELSDLLDLPIDADPITALTGRTEPYILLIDALDEAVNPRQAVDQFLIPLYEAGRNQPGGPRLLVGARRHLLDALPTNRSVLDLDDPTYLDAADVTSYVTKLLTGAGDPDSTSPYRRREDLARQVAAELSRIAGRSFLIAQLAARALANTPVAVTAEQVRAERQRWGDFAAAFDRDLERYGERAIAVRDLLRPLAWAEGAGLPRDLWPVAASAIAPIGATYTDTDIRWLLANAGGYVIEAVEDERAVYRLYHQQFADHFRSGAGVEAAQSAITIALLGHVQQGADGRRNWLAAQPYHRRHLATHAAAGGLIDSLIEDVDFLICADPDRLLLALPAARSDRARLTAAVYRRCVPALRAQPPEMRASQLELTAHQLGHRHLSKQLAAAFNARPVATLWARWQTSSDHQVLGRHDYWVCSVAVSELEGRPVIVSGGFDAKVRRWDLATGRPVGEPLRGHKNVVSSVAASELDGHPVIVSGGGDGKIRRWDLATGQPVGEPLPSKGVWAVGALRGRPVIVSGGATVRVWDLATWQPVGEPLRSHWVHVLTVAELEGRPVIVSGDEHGTVRVWDLATWQPIGEPLRGHDGEVEAVAVAQLDQRAVIISGGADATVRVWDLENGQPIGEPLRGHGDEVSGVAVGHFGQRAVIISGSHDATVRVWDLANGQPIGEPLRGHDGEVEAVAVAQLDQRAVIISGGADGTVRRWEMTTEQTAGKPLPGHEGEIKAVAVGHCAGRAVIVSGGADATVRVWDLTKGRRVGELMRATGAIAGVAVGQLGERPVIVSGTGSLGHLDGTVQVWDLATRRPIGKPMHHHEGLSSLAMTELEGRPVIVSGGGRAVRRWDLGTNQPIGKPLRCKSGVTTVAVGVLRGRPLIVSGHEDGTMRIWDLANGRPVGKRLHHGHWIHAVAAAQLDGRPVIVSGGGDATVRVWDLATRQPIGEPLRGHDNRVFAVAVGHYDGQAVIISGSYDATVQISDLATKIGYTPSLQVQSPVESLACVGQMCAVAASRGIAILRIR
jgi:WD40 repeat protein